jgi:hypothetical protein
MSYDTGEQYSARIHRKGVEGMKVKRGVVVFLAMWGVVMVTAVPALSQDRPADTMEIVHEKIRADKKLFVAENMQLTEAEAKGFWPVYERYQDELFLLRARVAQLIKDYAEAYETMTNETAKKLLDENMTIDSLALKLRQSYLSEFRTVLPEVKVVRYYQIENKINAVLIYDLARNIPLIQAGK